MPGKVWLLPGSAPPGADVNPLIRLISLAPVTPPSAGTPSPELLTFSAWVGEVHEKLTGVEPAKKPPYFPVAGQLSQPAGADLPKANDREIIFLDGNFWGERVGRVD